MTGHCMIARGRCALAFVLALAGMACESPVSERTIELDAMGSAIVTLFLDNNLNGQFDPQIDVPLPNQQFVLRRFGVADSLTFFTDDTGMAGVGALGIGRFLVTIAPSVRGDTLVSALDSVTFQLFADDTARVQLGVQYPELTIDAFRALMNGRRAWIHGVVLNSPVTFGDSTMHMADTTAAIRAVNLRFAIPVSPGDTLDVLGARRERAGQPATEPLIVIPRGGGLNPPPAPLSTAVAATADDGARDAAFVVVRNVAVTDTATTFTARLLTVDDGTGALVVSLHPGINPFQPQNFFAPGARLDVVGLLVPDPDTGTWVLKPRMRGDITILQLPPAP